jgi:hypothetical protein
LFWSFDVLDPVVDVVAYRDRFDTKEEEGEKKDSRE